LTSKNFASGRDIFCFGTETAVAELLELCDHLFIREDPVTIAFNAKWLFENDVPR